MPCLTLWCLYMPLQNATVPSHVPKAFLPLPGPGAVPTPGPNLACVPTKLVCLTSTAVHLPPTYPLRPPLLSRPAACSSYIRFPILIRPAASWPLQLPLRHPPSPTPPMLESSHTCSRCSVIHVFSKVRMIAARACASQAATSTC